MIRFVQLAALALLLAASTAARAGDETQSAGAESAAAALAGDQATIVFFRPKKLMGAAMGFKIRENDQELGKLRNASFFILKVPPGTHRYVVHSETEDVLTMEVEAGETYYVQGTLGMGIVAGRPNLAPSDRATFESIKDKLKERAPLDGSAEEVAAGEAK